MACEPTPLAEEIARVCFSHFLGVASTIGSPEKLLLVLHTGVSYRVQYPASAGGS